MGKNRFWLVTSGDLEKVRVRARDSREAFLMAVALYQPRGLGVIAEVVAEDPDPEILQRDPTATFYVSTALLGAAFQGGSDG